jgi:hypothetical protein
MGYNIVWQEKIFYHVFMDEKYLWIKMWMKNENGWTFYEHWQHIFCEKLNKKKRMEIFMLGLFLKIIHMKG